MDSTQLETLEESGSNKHFKILKETRDKISKSRKKWWEQMKKDTKKFALIKATISKNMKEIWDKRDENGVRVRKSHKQTDETKRKISEAHKIRWRKIKENKAKLKR